MNDTVKIVTTWSDAGYQEYGQYWCKAVSKYVPKDWKIKVYGTKQPYEYEWHDWDTEFPNWKEYCDSIRDAWWSTRDRGNYKFERWIDHVIKFTHKGVVIAKELATTDTRYMIWVDGDAIFHDTIPSDWHRQLLSGQAMSTQFEFRDKGDGWKWVHIESGIVVYDLHHPKIKAFIDEFTSFYADVKKLTSLRKPYDTYVAVAAMKSTEVPAFDLNLVTQRITGERENTFTNPLLRQYIEHWITKSKALLGARND